MHRRRFLALSAASFASCARSRSRSLAIRVAATPTYYMSPLFLAQELNYFSAEGLEVAIEQISRVVDAVPLLAAGKLDVGFYGLSGSFLNAIARGARLRIVAGRQFYTLECSRDSAIYGSRLAFPSGFHSLSQLKGKRIALGSIDGPSYFTLDSALAVAGLTRDDVTIVPLPENQAAVLMAQGKVDVVSSAREGAQLAIGDHIVVGPPLASFLPNHMYGFVSFGQRFLDHEIDAGVRFLRAYLRGMRDFVAGKNPRFLDEVAAKNGLDLQRARQVCRRNFVLDGHVDLPSIQRLLDYFVKQKLMNISIRAQQVVDTRFFDQLHLPRRSS